MSSATDQAALMREAFECIKCHVFVPFLRDLVAVQDLLHRLKALAEKIQMIPGEMRHTLRP